MSLEAVMGITAVVTELALLGILIYRRVWKSLPVFFAYCVWALVSDGVSYSIKFFVPGGYDLRFYVIEMSLDFALQFAVLVELGWSVLKPLRANLSRHALWVVAVLILGIGAAVWPFTSIAGITMHSRMWDFIVQMQQTVSILRIAFFLLLAACSHLLSMGWRDRELQVATGFGFYSFISIVVATINTHQVSARQFSNLYYAVAASFLCSVLYWIVSFSQKESERREFTPRMQNALLAAARAARLTRSSVNGLLELDAELPIA